MNVHHLELFYYVARHGGISRAVRHMPYGIQQPAISTQIRLLERDLGTELFSRSPFRLTKAGEELFAFVRPFFSNLEVVAARLGRPAAPSLRLGAAELMLRDCLPPIVQRLKAQHPDLQLSLRSGFTAQLEELLRAREIDLAIVPRDGRPPAGLRCVNLLSLPLVLLVPAAAKLRAAAELWAADRIETPLISLPETEIISRIFRRGLKRLWVDWPCTIEASSFDLISQYVANGYGYGVSVDLGGLVRRPKIRAVPLEGFAPLEIAMLWQGRETPLIQAVLAETQRYVARQWPKFEPAGGVTAGRR